MKTPIQTFTHIYTYLYINVLIQASRPTDFCRPGSVLSHMAKK